MKQKVFALVLSCMMLLSLVVSAASYSDVPETHDRYEAINMLSSLDIITGYPDGTFQPDKEVTRAEMAALITRMFNLTSTAVTEQPFSDVATDYWAVSNIVAAKNMKIINGFPDGTFKPQDNVTYEQAVKMIVCALNYGTAAEALGGYPAGYINQASKLNILQKAAYGNTKPAPRGIIAQLLFNSLKVDMLVPQVNPDGTVDFIKPENGNSVLEQFQKNQTLTGVTVVRTPRVNLLPGVVEIQNVNNDAMYVRTATGEYIKIFVGTYTDAFSFIGHQVDISYQADEFGGDTKTLTSINRSGNVQKYENIKLSNVVSLTNTELVYYTDKANERKNTIYFNGTPTVIYNERLHQSGITQLNTDLFSVSNHTYANGVISVYVGNNTLIKAKSYKNYVVEKTDSSNETIVVKGSSTPISIPYKETYVNETVIRKGNFDYNTGAVAANASKLTSYSGISKENIIAVASNTQDPASKYFEVLVSSNALNGTVNGMETDDETGRNLITVGTASATRLSEDLARYSQDTAIVMGMSAKFHLDPFGEIGYISAVKTQDVRLGIPVKVSAMGSGFDKVTKLEIYNVDTNQTETLSFNDEQDTSALKDAGSGKLITDYLFKYTLKNNKIETIAKLVAGSDENDYNSAYTDAEVTISKTNSTTITVDDPYDLISYPNLSINSKTKIILIGPKNSTQTVTPKTFTMATQTGYSGRVYKLNKTESNYPVQYVIVRPYEGLTTSSPTYIVDEIGRLTVEGVPVTVYNFTGTSKSGNTASAEILFSQTAMETLQLKKGDVFTYYDMPTEEEYDVESASNVVILARADEIATGTYPSQDYLQEVSRDPLVYNTNFRMLAIKSNSSNVVDPSGNNVHTYYMGIAADCVFDENGKPKGLRIAKNSSNKLPVMPNDASDITNIKNDIANDANTYNYDISSLANIYVYDASASGSEKLQQIKGRDNIVEYFDNLRVINENTGNKYDTLFVKAYNPNDGGNNQLYNLYIIKDVRP